MYLIPGPLRNVLVPVVVLGVLVFIHELGHYLAARWRGVHVEAFSIGFGRAIARWTDSAGTAWRVGWIPLGGYVKLHGQEQPHDVPADVRAGWVPGRTFHEKGVGSRAIVVAAGPIANFLLAAVLFAGLIMVNGRPIPVPTGVGEVAENGPASRAGLRAGDRLVSIDGTPVTTFEDVVRIVSAAPDRAITVAATRDGQRIELPVQTGSREDNGKRIGLLGIKSGLVDYERVNPLVAVASGFTQTWDLVGLIGTGLKQVITRERGTDELGGPLRIIQLSSQVAEHGLGSLVRLTAFLSVNLALFNLLPIPVLDGGHLLFYLLEAIRGRPVPARAQEIGFRAGFAVLATLFLFATWNDLSHLGVVRWISGLIS